MDRECVSLLPSVCEVLADSGRSLPDDTSLEKLVDWFTGLAEAGVSLPEACPCLLEFISTVVRNTASDPGVLSFSLRLTGLMAATQDGFKMLQEHSVLNQVFNLQHWQDAGLWEDPCLRIGWIQGLRSMLQHPKALSFFVQSDFIGPLLQLQTDTSLFIASAANQMLAHILLFFQPVSSAGCNGVAKKEEEEDRRTHVSITDSEDPALTLETSAEYTTVVTVMSEYLKESLVPPENTKLHQSLQILKLLALLLAQAGPPLRDELLQTVADSLQELVTAGCSQLTLPLMDVILAACSSSGTDERVPDQRVAHLLSSMLNINKPADLMHAAAAFLRRGHHDAVHTARAVRILLLPLDVITGQTLLGTNTTDEHQLMAEQMKSKTSCISMTCVCLTNTPLITLKPSSILPCPPQLIVTAVLSLLRICSGVSFSSSAGCSEVCGNVIGSGKVQKCALEALTALSSSPGAKEKVSEVFTALIQYLDNPGSDPTVLHKSYQVLVKWMSVCTDLSFITDQLRQDLVEVVRKRVCDMRWEVRDSTVEFLGHLAGVPVPPKSAEEEEVCDVSDALLGSCCTTPLLREALQDMESYVRASAVSALAKTLRHSWQQGAALTQEETEIVGRLLEILSQDTEGFPRRAVVQYFIAWFSVHVSHSPPSSSSSASLLMQCVRSVLSQGSADLDWEVKVHTLELAELLLDKAFSGHRGYRNGSDVNRAPPHPYGVISEQTYTLHSHTGTHTEGVESDLAGVVEQGVVSALLSGLVDCDRPVALKACRLLITLRDTVCPPSLGALDATAAMATVSCELPGWGWGQEIRRILGMKESDRATETDTAAQRSFSEADEGGDGVTVSVCETLRSLGLDERLDVLTQSSDHIHNSPLSLLQDILTASAAHTHPDTQQGQEVIVDCY
ncbi:BRCA1-associated ATM activator 1 isoform X3 [Epinephelus fuscoguttatus]|uniref:BRCA1-associated ATM activator 1 isoform X3 n=1 Tax=Epinephelus fuscoguttatus TaxID=293821 RepID=UPI0020D1BCD0|nr:BRCA1-associated ATM activator 1 isoform X3 [Epinephelus fuscoguttatus]